MRDRNAPLTLDEIDRLDWAKMDGLVPAAVQDQRSGQLLMLGYMTREALAATLTTNRVTFWSRSRQCLWTKGETSGHFLSLAAIHVDCDDDSLLLLAEPEGPICHLGSTSCFGEALPDGAAWLGQLSRIVADRASNGDAESYTRRLLAEGPARIAQKIGEEGVEIALAAVGRSNQACAEEVADLLYHLAVLMESRGFGWSDVTAILQARHRSAIAPG